MGYLHRVSSTDGIVSGRNLLSEQFLLQLFWGHLEELPPICSGQVQPEQIVRTLPFALALAEDSTMPVQALEIEQTLAHMTMAVLMHPL
jgi:hypothetical protein